MSSEIENLLADYKANWAVRKNVFADMSFWGVGIYKTNADGTVIHIYPNSKEGLKLQQKMAAIQLYKAQVDKLFNFYSIEPKTNNQW